MEHKPERFYSEQTQEIMGQIPSWILRWGMGVIFAVLLGIIIGSYFIKYPQIVTAPITITTINPPSDLIAKSTGRIDTIFARDGQSLSVGEPVAMLQNTASYDDVMVVASELDTFDMDSISWMGLNYRMGELQGSFSELRRQCLDFKHYNEAQNIPHKKSLLATQIAKYKRYHAQLLSQKSLITSDLHYTIKNFERDSLLFAQGVISPLEIERSAQAAIQKRNSLAGFEASLTNNELTILQMEQQLFELEMQYDNETSAYRRQIGESAQQLAAQIRQWKQSYLLTSPIVGRLSFTKYWSENQNVQMGEKLATVVPLDSTQVIGIMTVPSAGFGRVAVGQKVNIKLNGYPYFEYGILKGIVTRLSSVPDGTNGYIAEVAFPDGLQSTYKEQLTLIQQMDGTGDIVTKDERLIQRFIQPIRALIDKISN